MKTIHRIGGFLVAGLLLILGRKLNKIKSTYVLAENGSINSHVLHDIAADYYRTRFRKWWRRNNGVCYRALSKHWQHRILAVADDASRFMLTLETKPTTILTSDNSEQCLAVEIHRYFTGHNKEDLRLVKAEVNPEVVQIATLNMPGLISADDRVFIALPLLSARDTLSGLINLCYISGASIVGVYVFASSSQMMTQRIRYALDHFKTKPPLLVAVQFNLKNEAG
ncbi:MAG: hypothetical protein NUV82_04625 [Candidatus Komeilibacteria bacterium]|nr:hypothetical protein [Candidatus Komeilibacteria bacterium]